MIVINNRDLLISVEIVHTKGGLLWCIKSTYNYIPCEEYHQLDAWEVASMALSNDIIEVKFVEMMC